MSDARSPVAEGPATEERLAESARSGSRHASGRVGLAAATA
jgi:hypothetical protein